MSNPKLVIENILDDIHEEVLYQQERWGKQDHNAPMWISIIGEEFGEAAKAVNEGNKENLRRELIQVAAVCVSAIESLNNEETE